jgi:four helix bundle protein
LKKSSALREKVERKDEGGGMKDERNDLNLRTKRYSLDVIKLFVSLPKSEVGKVLGRQMLRSATSVGAQYREANRGKSTADFISQIEGALQELDETSYWLELLQESGINQTEALVNLLHETEELIAIFVTIAKTAKLRKTKSDRT